MTRATEMTSLLRHAAVRYGIAVVLTVAATAYGRDLHPLVNVGIVLLFLLTVVLSAAMGGVGPGLVAGMLSIVAIDWFFLAPPETLRVVATADFVLLALYAAVAFVTAGVVGLLSRWWTEQRIRASRAEGMAQYLGRQLEASEGDVRANDVLRAASRLAIVRRKQTRD